jgi:phage terminase large subunit-like protein
MFQYYDKNLLKEHGQGRWTINGRRLNIHAAVDFAFSLRKEADYSCVIVVGVDSQNNYYVLDIERFKTGKISEYFDRILRMYSAWGFRKITAEVSVAQKVIVDDLRMNYIRPHGLALTVNDSRPTAREGTKLERIQANLQNKYENLQMWHYQGGNCQVLEEELVQQKPPHDDVKDALSTCVENMVTPSGGFQGIGTGLQGSYGNYTRATDVMNTRFGGIG